MPRLLSAFFLLFFGAGLLAVAWHGYNAGELPAGRKGFSAYRPNREDNPFAFHFFLILYLCSGVVLCVWGLLALLGLAPALKWR